jgi:hypothetical protein
MPTNATDTGIIRIVDENLRQGFAQVPRPVLRAKGLSIKAKAVYILLLDYAWQQGSCFPGHARLAEDLDTSIDTIQRALTELKRFKLIDWKRQGLNRPNIYYMLALSENPHLGLGDSGNRNLRYPDTAALRHQETATSGTKNTQVNIPRRKIRKAPLENSDQLTGETARAASAVAVDQVASEPPATPERNPRDAARDALLPAPPCVGSDPVIPDPTSASASEPEGEGLRTFRDQARRLRAELAAQRELHQQPSAEGTAAHPSHGSRRGRPPGTREERDQVAAYLADFAIELNDQAPLAATITRAINAFHSANIPREHWGDYLYQARSITQDHSAAIATRVPGQEQTMRAKNKIPYYFAVLEHLLGLRLAPEARATEDPG